MNERRIINPHANFFQKVFSRIDVAHDFVLNYLPKKLVHRLDLSTLEIDRESFVDILLSATQSDLIFKVNTKDGKKLLIYFLIEHKSFLDKWVLFQLLGYTVRINEREREIKALARKEARQANIDNGFPENKGIEKECITVVVPVIFYHGQKDWNIQNLSSLYCDSGGLVNYIPEFDYELVDLSSYNIEEITGNVYLKVAIIVMKHYYSDEFDSLLFQALLLLNDYVDDWTTIYFISIVLLYSSSHKSRGQKWLSLTIENKFNEAFGEKGGMVMNAVSNIWIEQGKKEGLLEKAREMVIEVLKVKYHSVSHSISGFIQKVKDENILRNLLREAILCNDINEFQYRLQKITV